MRSKRFEWSGSRNSLRISRSVARLELNAPASSPVEGIRLKLRTSTVPKFENLGVGVERYLIPTSRVSDFHPCWPVGCWRDPVIAVSTRLLGERVVGNLFDHFAPGHGSCSISIEYLLRRLHLCSSPRFAVGKYCRITHSRVRLVEHVRFWQPVSA